MDNVQLSSALWLLIILAITWLEADPTATILQGDNCILPGVENEER
jgi:hypothetical protein